MVQEIGSIDALSPVFQTDDFQSDIYEYADDYTRVRARAKAGGLDHAPNIYISVTIYGPIEHFAEKDSITSDSCEIPEVASVLAEIEDLVAAYSDSSPPEFKFKQVEDGGAVSFDISIER